MVGKSHPLPPADTPYWIRVIRHFLAKGYFQNGLTLPFLIGARTIVDPDQPLLSIAAFVQYATEYPVGTTMIRCTNIGEYVFAELDTESRRYANFYPRIGQLHITDDSFDISKGVAELVDVFTSCYSDYLEQQRYSKNGGEWGSFSSADLHRLYEVAEKGQR